MNLTWQKLSEEPYKAGFRKMLRKVFKLPDGREQTFDIKDEGCPICILALTKEDQVIMAKQYRPGPEKVLLEIPGGGSEPNEKPLQAAERELLEETGYKGDLQFVGSCWNSAYSNHLTHHFVALNCKYVGVQNRDSDEFIEVVTMSLPEFRKHLQSGELTDAKTGYACLDFLGKLS